MDTQIISREESYKVPETACAFANSSGGVIVGDGFDAAKFIPPDVPYVAEDYGVYVPPLVWHKKPALCHGRVYRRIEGENVISGLRAKIIMAGEAHDSSRDDYPVENMTLREESIRRYCDKANDSGMPREKFLRKIGVYSGKFMTFAGALMFGEILRIRAVMDYSGHVEISAVNIWDAFTEILPRLVYPLSSKCAEAFTEMFINSLLHADYNADNRINFVITPNPPKVFADNPGTIRGTIRNHRIRKILAMSGMIKRRKIHGLDIIRDYMPSFRLDENMLDLRTSATLILEGKSILPKPVMLI